MWRWLRRVVSAVRAVRGVGVRWPDIEPIADGGDLPLADQVVVITGNGRGFCSGADLTAADRRPVPAAPHDPAFAWCVDLLELPKPTIAPPQ